MHRLVDLINSKYDAIYINGETGSVEPENVDGWKCKLLRLLTSTTWKNGTRAISDKSLSIKGETYAGANYKDRLTVSLRVSQVGVFQ